MVVLVFVELLILTFLPAFERILDVNAPKAFAKAADVCINEPNTTTDVTQSLNKESQWQFNDTIKKKKKKKSQ